MIPKHSFVKLSKQGGVRRAATVRRALANEGSTPSNSFGLQPVEPYQLRGLLAESSNEAFKQELKKFMAEMQEGDQVFRYSTPEISWEEWGGGEGFMLLRDGKPIGYLVLQDTVE